MLIPEFSFKLILFCIAQISYAVNYYYIDACNNLHSGTQNGLAASPYQSLLQALYDQRQTGTQTGSKKYCNNPSIDDCVFYLDAGQTYYLFTSTSSCEDSNSDVASDPRKQPLNTYSYTSSGTKTITIKSDTAGTKANVYYWEAGVQLNAIKVNLKFVDIAFSGYEFIQNLLNCFPCNDQ